MGVEARLGRAKTAPETGNVDEQVCSVESAAEGEKQYEYTDADCEEEFIERVHEFMNDWGDKVITGPFEARDNQMECTENGEMSPHKIVKLSPCQIGSMENGEMSHEEIEKVSDEQSRYPQWPGQAGEGRCLRSIAEETEGDPIRYALAM